MKRSYKIAVIPGDGTGPEVVQEGLKVLAAVSGAEGFKTELVAYDFGGERYLKTGETVPDSALDELREFRGTRYDADAVDACVRMVGRDDFAWPGSGQG